MNQNTRNIDHMEINNEGPIWLRLRFLRHEIKWKWNLRIGIDVDGFDNWNLQRIDNKVIRQLRNKKKRGA